MDTLDRFMVILMILGAIAMSVISDHAIKKDVKQLERKVHELEAKQERELERRVHELEAKQERGRF